MRRAITVKSKYKEQTTPRRRSGQLGRSSSHRYIYYPHSLTKGLSSTTIQRSTDINLLRHDLTGDDVLARLLDFL